MKRLAMTVALGIIVSAPSAMGVKQPSRSCDEEASALGRKVLAIQQALADPATPDALDAIQALGLDSRHYVMVRGWLAMQLASDRSIASARGDATPQHIWQRIDFLEQALRSIDFGMMLATGPHK